MSRSLLFLAALLPVCFGLPEWRFQIDENKLLVFNISAGTPSQSLSIATFHLGFFHPLRVPDASIDGGLFNSQKSSTWSKVGNSLDKNGTVNGLVGTDTITITDGLTIKKSQSFEVINKDWMFPGDGLFTLSRSSDGTTAFSEKILENQSKKLITLTYDYWKTPSKTTGLTGTVTIGGKATKNCAPKWTMLPEAVYQDRPFEQWTVNVNKLQIGKYVFTSPGQASFQLNDDGVGIPAGIYDSVLKGLGSVDGTTIPCDVTTSIVFSLDQSLTLTLAPADFTRKNKDGSCTIAANRLDKARYGFILPVYVLRDYCLLLDYAQTQIGLSKRTF